MKSDVPKTRWRGRTRSLLVVCCAAAWVLAAGNMVSAEEPPPVENLSPAGEPGAAEKNDANEEIGGPEPASVTAAAREAPAPTPGRGQATRLRARSATVVIRSFAPADTMAAAVQKAEELGGFVQSSETGESRMKVPMAALDNALIALRDIGEVVDERVESDDVTLEIITVEARIQELESSRVRVKGMLTLAGNVGESLSIEKELEQVTGELEQQQGRLRYLQERVQSAPVTIQVSMKARPRVERPSKRRPFEWVHEYGPNRLLR